MSVQITLIVTIQVLIQVAVNQENDDVNEDDYHKEMNKKYEVDSDDTKTTAENLNVSSACSSIH